MQHYVEIVLQTDSYALRTYLKHLNLYCATATYRECKVGDNYQITLGGIEWDYFYNNVEGVLYGRLTTEKERAAYDRTLELLVTEVAADKKRERAEAKAKIRAAYAAPLNLITNEVANDIEALPWRNLTITWDELVTVQAAGR